MSVELVQVKVEPEDKEQEWDCEPELGPELMQAPEVAWPLEGTTAAMHTIKQELSVEGPSDECSGNETETSTRADLHQKHSITIEVKIEPDFIKKEVETEENEVGEDWRGMNEAWAGSYAGHAVKHKLEVGPELQVPHVTALPGTSAEPRPASQALVAERASDEFPVKGPRFYESHGKRLELRTCYVRLERLFVYTNKPLGPLPSRQPHRCPVCKKMFSRRDALKIHSRLHTGEKPYECDVCHKQFTQATNLVVHKRVHTGEKTCACEICNKQFARSSDLVRHKRMHAGQKPYKCDICNKRFAQSSNLGKHKWVHTGVKPYSCDICNKRFTRASNLNTHKQIHTGEKPFACDICNKRFFQSGNLIQHKRIHTGKEV